MKFRPNRHLFSIGMASVILIMCSGNPLEDFWKKQMEEIPKPWWSRPDTLTVNIIGDVMMHSEQLRYDCRPFLELISGELRSADFSIANMEFPLGGEPYSGYPAFSTPDYYADYASECGIDIFLTANNHICDKGSGGFRRTLDYYSSMEGISYTGSGLSDEDMKSRNPVFLQHKGIRVAVINFTYGSNSRSNSPWPKVMKESDRESILEAIQRAKESKADIIIACPHWGYEYKLRHSSQQEDTARWLIENGVDLIVGSHPHVVQDMQMIDGVPVFYSIGNAVSNMSAANTQLGLMVKLKIIRDSNGNTRIGDINEVWTWCSRPGGLRENYSTIPVAEFRNNRDIWKNVYDYEKMITTLERVSKETGIPEQK